MKRNAILELEFKSQQIRVKSQFKIFVLYNICER